VPDISNPIKNARVVADGCHTGSKNDSGNTPSRVDPDLPCEAYVGFDANGDQVGTFHAVLAGENVER
jgi:hypothetical protein